MNLSFNNLTELDEFLGWAAAYKQAGTISVNLGDLVPGTLQALDPLPTIDEHAFDTPPAVVSSGATQAELEAQAVAEINAAGQPKRKRRTKAEIEAAAASEAKPEEAAALAEAVQQDKAAEGQMQPEGTNPFELAAAPAVDPAAPAGDTPAADGDEPAVVTPFQHLTRGREFIAKHGMPKYLETFTKAGTDPNVMGYSAYQRGLHMAAMDELDKA